jgi:transcriptional regulator with XRE-family HTH domain
MTQGPNDYQLATQALKVILRAQKVTYRELAKAIGLSESGIKKVLSAKDGSFQRLAQMGRYVGASINELLDQRSSHMTEVTFSPEAQAEFLEDPELFQFYWLLVYERMSLEDLSKARSISEKDRFKYLRKLDRLRLLMLLPDGRVRIPPVQQIRWVGDGPLIRKLYREWSTRMIQNVARPDLEPGKLFIVRYFKASAKTHADLLRAQTELEAEFVRRAIQDMRTEAEDLEHLRWVVGIDQQSFIT